MRIKMKWKQIFTMSAAVMLCAASLNISALAAKTASAGDIVIQIVHTNDIHGRSAHVKDETVGFEKLATYIRQQEADLVVDAGDLLHGQAFATLEQGGSIAELVKAVGYDVITPGNHDWNYGKDRLKELASLSGAVMLAGNVTQDSSNFFGNDGTFTKTVDGIKIGVLGVFDPDVKTATAPRNVEGLTFADDAETATKLAQKLREDGCDIVIALSHQLYCEDFISRTKGIDVLIAGHEHMVLDNYYPDANGKEVKVVETGYYFQNVGCLSITYDPNEGKIVSMEEQLLSAQDAEGLDSDETITKLMSEISERQKKQLTQVVGTTGHELDGKWEDLRVEETGLGRLVTAAYLKETGADIAFENAGGIRLGKTLPAGNITYQDIIDISPFGNYIVTKQITGEAVRSILEKSIDIGIKNKISYDEWIKTGSDQVRWPDHNGNYLQFGGLTAVYTPDKPMGERVLTAEVNGEALNPKKLYTIATNNYISVGQTFSELADVPELNQYSACDEALLRFILSGQETVDKAVSSAGIQQGENPNQELPKTGDNSRIPVEAGMIIIFGAAFCILCMKSGRKAE